MRPLRRFALLALAALATGCDRTDQPAGGRVQDFALALPVEATGTGVGELALPPAALVALRRADRGDVRIFDAQGRALALALAPTATRRAALARVAAVPFAAPPPAEGPGIAVRIEQDRQAVSVTAPAAGPGSGPHAVLLDMRALREPMTALALEADLPPGVPVTLRLAASPDLRDWQDIAEQVLFRPAPGAPLLGAEIALPRPVPAGRYLRISWDGTPAARIVAARPVAAPARTVPDVTVATRGATLGDAHTLSFPLPAGPAPSALRLGLTGPDGVVPVRLEGRLAGDAVWTPLAFGVLRQGEPARRLALPPGGWRELRVVADPRTAGFSRAPALALDLAPLSLLAAFNGAAPYRLAVGNAAAPPALLAAGDLAAHAPVTVRARVPENPAAPVLALDAEAGPAHPAPRVVALWLVLIGGVLALGLAAYRLLRDNAAPR